MKSSYFNKNMIPTILIFGVAGSILLIFFIILSHKFNIKVIFGTIIYPLIIFSTLLFYKIKQKNNINYWKAVILTFLVCSTMTLPVIIYIIIGRMDELIAMYLEISFLQLITPFFYMLMVGIIISLITGMFFLNSKNKVV
ncbi:MAG: hypothetical protein COW67_02515 [Flavobacteriales bacterium CG18_big_fil_WC_8_21_14_2_50_32_9]|nr:MAG: hypothetical protein COW67_02515 [Flavobacteriales bacterium CG18_big_fil_WC_8_21_14_2_50_32_9]